MIARPRAAGFLALALVAAGVLAIYLPGLGNGLVYDDGYLAQGLFDDYRSFALRARMLSYGSFVWLHSLLGDGWWKQRLVNLAIHLAVVVALWALYREILSHIEPSAADAAEGGPPPRYETSPALGVAIGFFALNPVAVYAVAYLIQRSILLATLLVVLGLWLFTLALNGRRWLHVPALACYALALVSKEHAVLAPVAAVPLYIVVARPGGKRLGVIAIVVALLVGVAALVLSHRYGDILGRPFDEYSRVYLAQLSRIDPDAGRHAYALSIMNQSWLFFRYGIDWLLPWSGWMSIDLRPPFPVRWLTFPQVLGLLAYPALLVGGFVLVLRYRDWRALAGLSILLPALLFGTEFATVWVQDPFVLYRSYLWAIGVPGLVFLLVHGPSARVLLVIGAVLGALLVWQALDRVFSMQNAETVWTDAIQKLPDDPRAVGRWFPYLNRGSVYADANRFDLAKVDFEASAALGDEGMGEYDLGAVLYAQRRYEEALAAFARAQKEGYQLYNLPFQRGLALQALGRASEARQQFEAALAMKPPSPAREILLLNLGRVAMQVGAPDVAAAALGQLLEREPHNGEGRYLLGMAYVMMNRPADAVAVLDKLIAEAPSGIAHYARAIANYRLGRKREALADIEAAERSAPGIANLGEWRAKILAMP